MRDSISFQFAVYYLSVPTNDPITVLDAILSNNFPTIRRVAELKPGTDVCVASRHLTNVQTSYAPPSLEALKHSGRGLTRRQALALQNSQHALLLNFGYSRKHVWNGMRSALELTCALARQTGGTLWDEATREAFTPDALETNRLATWDVEVPDMSKHTVIHAYQQEKGFIRAITLGMEKFGLPDTVIENFSWAENRNIGHLINLFEQAIAEGATIQTSGEFDLDLRTIKNHRVRDPQLLSLKSNATAKAFLSLQEGRWEKGDPQNRLVEITFDRYKHRDLHARQLKLLSALFGWEQQVKNVTHHDQRLLAASREARKNLNALRQHFNQGMEPGEYILVKVPFPVASGGNEYMWVEVSRWNGDAIEGLLQNEPVKIPALHGGQMVNVSEAKVFDYIHALADGSQEGNETGRLMESRGPSSEQ